MICADAGALPYATGSAHAAITSPAYWGGLRAYPVLHATRWPEVAYPPMPGLPPVVIPASDEELGHERDPFAYIGHLLLIFREARRVLRDDGVLAVNIGDCYASRRGQGKVAGGGRDGERWTGMATQPSQLPIPGVQPKCLLLMPWRLALAMIADGWILRSRMPTGLEVEPDALWTKPAAMPRSVNDRPTEDFEDVLLFSQRRHYSWDLVNALVPYAGEVRASKASRSAMLAQAALRPRGNLNSHRDESIERFYARGGRNMRAAWPVVAETTGLPHYAAYPSELVAKILKVITADAGACSACGAQWRREIVKDDDGGFIGYSSWHPACECGADPEPCRVLDPFAGIGRTDEACRKTGRLYMGSDLSPEYCQLHRWRLAEDVDQRPRRAKAMEITGPLFSL